MAGALSAIRENTVSPGLLEQLSAGGTFHVLIFGSPQRSTSHSQAGQARQGAGSENVFGQMVLLPLGR